MPSALKPLEPGPRPGAWRRVRIFERTTDVGAGVAATLRPGFARAALASTAGYDLQTEGDPLRISIPSGSQGEFLDEPVGDWPARREGDAGLGRFEPGRGNVAGMRLDGGRRQIEAALLAERRIARDDGLSDPEPRHVVGDDFFGVSQRARKLGAQSNQQRTKAFRSPGAASFLDPLPTISQRPVRAAAPRCASLRGERE